MSVTVFDCSHKLEGSLAENCSRGQLAQGKMDTIHVRTAFTCVLSVTRTLKPDPPEKSAGRPLYQ